VLGLSPLHAGLTFLPMALTIMFVRTRRRQRRQPLRRARGARLGAADDDRRDAAVHEDRRQRLGDRLRDDPRAADAAGIGLSIVPSTIAATQGAKAGSDRARVRTGEHLAPESAADWGSQC